MSAAQTIAVIVRATDPHRVAEALRAAVGLGLRGARVEVALERPLPADPHVDRAAKTLAVLGQTITEETDLRALLARSDAVEVWT